MRIIKKILIAIIVLFVGSAVIAGIADSGKKNTTVKVHSESKKEEPKAKKELRKIIKAYTDINQGMSEEDVKKILSAVGGVEEFKNIGDKSLGYIKDEISVKDGKEAIIIGFKDGKVNSKNYSVDITDMAGKTDYAYINYDNNGNYESGIWDKDGTKKNLAPNKSEDEIETKVIELYN